MEAKIDGAEFLSNLSGVSREEVLDLWRQVKENHDRLASCQRHRFEPPAELKLGARYHCTVCGGEMRLDAISAYIGGYVSNGGNADDIWPGWK